jgi:hypothetical protein
MAPSFEVVRRRGRGDLLEAAKMIAATFLLLPVPLVLDKFSNCCHINACWTSVFTDDNHA